MRTKGTREAPNLLVLPKEVAGPVDARRGCTACWAQGRQLGSCTRSRAMLLEQTCKALPESGKAHLEDVQAGGIGRHGRKKASNTCDSHLAGASISDQ